jgi:molybdopterin synthase catalytic subunit
MRVRLLLFATLKDIVGAREMQLDLPSGTTIADLLTRLERDYPGIKGYRPVVLTAINEEYVNQSSAIADGDEVAIFPPVSGGAL